jgi:hypothetical protein|tara:strand:+ start:357 stop:869 length:513 start_codon:yes stop_codon:yes gene_type:complete
MKKKYLSAILFLFFLSNEVNSQIITFFDFTGSMSSYNIADVQKITFGYSGYVFLFFNDGETITIPSDEFRSYQYNQGVLNIDDFNTSLNNLELYPNPTEDLIKLHFIAQSTFPYSYIIYDINGSKVVNKNIGLVSGSYTEQVSLTKFSSGIYFLVLENGKNRISKKIIKK